MAREGTHYHDAVIGFAIFPCLGAAFRHSDISSATKISFMAYIRDPLESKFSPAIYDCSLFFFMLP